MVVDWTGKKPNREGFWLCAIRATGSKGFTPFLLYVHQGSNGILHASTKHDMFNRNSFLLDDLFETRNVVYGFTCDFEIKCATAPIQIDNIDWDYKLQKGE